MDYAYGRVLIPSLTTTQQVATAGTVTPSDPLVLHSLDLVNNSSSAAYVQVFDQLVTYVTLGVTSPKLSYWVGASSGRSIINLDAAFDLAISVAATTGVNNGTVAGSGVIVNAVFDV